MPPTADQLAQLRAMAAADADPTLTDDELAAVLGANVLPDAVGRAPADTDWQPTYAMGAAAQDAWLAKAGKAANRVDASDGSLSVQRSQLIDHCLLMADRYGARRLGTLVLAGTTGPAELTRLPVWNDDRVMPDGDSMTTPWGAEPGAYETPGATP